MEAAESIVKELEGVQVLLKNGFRMPIQTESRVSSTASLAWNAARMHLDAVLSVPSSAAEAIDAIESTRVAAPSTSISPVISSA